LGVVNINNHPFRPSAYRFHLSDQRRGGRSQVKVTPAVFSLRD